MTHLFLTGAKGVGKSTLVQALLADFPGKAGGFHTMRCDSAVYLLSTATGTEPSPENLLFHCGQPDPLTARRFDTLGVAALRNGGDILVMDELGPHEEDAHLFQRQVLLRLDGPVPILGVLQNSDTPFLRSVAAHPHVRLITVTAENRDHLSLSLPSIFPVR